MDVSELSLNQPSFIGANDLMSSGMRTGEAQIDHEDEKLKKVAKDFESVFIHKLLDTMKDTIPESDLEDSSSKQIKSMYWSFLAQAVADQGGLGLWEQIYEQMPKPNAAQAAADAMKNEVQPAHRLDESI